jgi:hypothetical protein
LHTVAADQILPFVPFDLFSLQEEKQTQASVLRQDISAAIHAQIRFGNTLSNFLLEYLKGKVGKFCFTQKVEV